MRFDSPKDPAAASRTPYEGKVNLRVGQRYPYLRSASLFNVVYLTLPLLFVFFTLSNMSVGNSLYREYSKPRRVFRLQVVYVENRTVCRKEICFLSGNKYNESIFFYNGNSFSFCLLYYYQLCNFSARPSTNIQNFLKKKI